PTDEDVRWARQRWPEITREELERGRALYVRKCAGCHNLHRPDEYPPEAWPDLVAKMQDEAEIGAVEVERIGKYLSTASAHLAAEHSR
ncbi:MAG: cytochrome c, partial [Deltaproteobacteria bacterium]